MKIPEIDLIKGKMYLVKHHNPMGEPSPITGRFYWRGDHFWMNFWTWDLEITYEQAISVKKDPDIDYGPIPKWKDPREWRD